MTEKNFDLLSLYAGLDITYPAAGTGASIQKAVSCFFTKAENALNHLHPKTNRTHF
jgi:hypothetical protein